MSTAFAALVWVLVIGFGVTFALVLFVVTVALWRIFLDSRR